MSCVLGSRFFSIYLNDTKIYTTSLYKKMLEPKNRGSPTPKKICWVEHFQYLACTVGYPSTVYSYIVSQTKHEEANTHTKLPCSKQYVVSLNLSSVKPGRFALRTRVSSFAYRGRGDARYMQSRKTFFFVANANRLIDDIIINNIAPMTNTVQGQVDSQEVNYTL